MNLPMLNKNGDNKYVFPRELTELEREILFSVLPENKPGYKIYRDKISRLKVTGTGRFGGGNFILGKEGSLPDLSVSSAPVFASGTIEFEDCVADINIHEEMDNEIEFDISFSKEKIPSLLHEKKDGAIPDGCPVKKRLRITPASEKLILATHGIYLLLLRLIKESGFTIALPG